MSYFEIILMFFLFIIRNSTHRNIAGGWSDRLFRDQWANSHRDVYRTDDEDSWGESIIWELEFRTGG